MFVYDDDQGGRVVVLTRPMSSADQNAPMAAQSNGGATGFTWVDNGIGYSLVGEAPARDSCSRDRASRSITTIAIVGQARPEPSLIPELLFVQRLSRLNPVKMVVSSGQSRCPGHCE